MIQPVHSVSGRTRYKIKGLYRSEPLKHTLESKLSAMPQVISASASPLTGKLLVHYRSGSTPDMIASAVQEILLDHGAANREHDSSDRFNATESPNAPEIRPNPTVGNSRMQTGSSSVAGSQEQTEAPWHLMTVDEILDTMNTSKDSGLSEKAAEKMLQRYGPNQLPEMQRPSQLNMFLGQFTTLPVALLTIAAGLSIGIGGLLDAIIIMGVLTVNATIGFLTERKAEQTISSLKTLVKPQTRVIRQGKEIKLSADQVVPGDLLVLKPGTYIAADSRVVAANHLSVDESALTGESMPVVKSTAVPSGRNVPLADRCDMVFMGTVVTGGQGLGIVAATGRFTEIGKLQEMVSGAETPQTPLEKQLKHVGDQLVMVSGGICVLVFGIGLLRGYTLIQMLRTAVYLAAAAVPEGLPTIATTTLALGMNSLRHDHVLIRKLGAVETLGSVQTICFDKTGTITLNELSVVAVHSGMKLFHIQDRTFNLEGEPIDPLQCEEFLRLMHMCVLCSETQLDDTETAEAGKQNRKYILKGSSTENALVQLAIDAGIDVKELRKAHPLLHVTHRSENRLFMSTLHESKEEGRLIALKGSPAEVLEMCAWQVKNGEQVPLTEEDKETIQRENERMAGRALRVLAVAYAVDEESEGQAIRENNFIWLGLAGMADSIREGVKELIGVFHQAGVKTVMLTGDQSPTAYAVARELNLSEGDQIKILESSHLEGMDPDALQALFQRVHVFARISPSHKLQIVQSLQSAGQVIAMTGDGINDSPALKSADIGIAMGEAGTDIAREVADVVLEQDDLETLAVAIEGGRSIYENIRKAVHFLVATNLSEIMVTFVCITGGLGHPLNARQLLWINTLSDIFPGLVLSMEPAEPGVMKRPPRNPEEHIIRKQDMKRMVFESAMISGGALGAYGYGILRYGMGATASTLVFQGLTVGQLLHTLSCRSEKHTMFDPNLSPPGKYLNLALGGSLALQGVSMLIPGLRNLLGLTPINLLDAAVIGGSAVLPFLINENTKKITNAGSQSKGEAAAS